MWPSKSMIERGDERHSGKTEKRKGDDPFADTNAVGYCRPQNTNGLGMQMGRFRAPADGSPSMSANKK